MYSYQILQRSTVLPNSSHIVTESQKRYGAKVALFSLGMQLLPRLSQTTPTKVKSECFSSSTEAPLLLESSPSREHLHSITPHRKKTTERAYLYRKQKRGKRDKKISILIKKSLSYLCSTTTQNEKQCVTLCPFILFFKPWNSWKEATF